MYKPKLKPLALSAAMLFLLAMMAWPAAAQQQNGQTGNEPAAAPENNPIEETIRPDSAKINQLFRQIHAETARLDADARELESFHRTSTAWAGHADQIEMVRQHVNEAGKLDQQLRAAREEGSAWQQESIDRIHPLLKELAGNLASTIDFLGAHQERMLPPAYNELVRKNAEMSHNLHMMIEDAMNYAESKHELDGLKARENARQ